MQYFLVSLKKLAGGKAALRRNCLVEKLGSFYFWLSSKLVSTKSIKKLVGIKAG